jgi:hypothetical protein
MAAAIAALPFSPDLIIDKDRNSSTSWSWRSSARPTLTWASDSTAAQSTWAGYSGSVNKIARAFKKHSRVFNEVAYTGNGTTQQIPHGLDPSVLVGQVIIKRLDAAAAGVSWNRGATGKYMVLNATAGAVVSANRFGNNSISIDPDSSVVTVGSSTDVNASGGSYSMLIFAHDTAPDGVIQCGAVLAGAQANLGWSPATLISKEIDFSGGWFTFDVATGWNSSSNDPVLYLNSVNSEAGANDYGGPNATGFTQQNSPSRTSTYLAMRAP